MKWWRHPRLASALGFLILIALIWFVGPLVGLASAEARLIGICVVMLLWVASLLVGSLLARRAGALLERMLRRDADEAVMGAASDRRAEVTLLRQRLLSAIETLRQSRLGKTRGKAALYELPWYMIIGHPAAGKSSAILHSGLSFPFGDKTVVQGVGGTRNCDWFFSTDGVLLDTAGRYATQREDRPEWLAFLRLLRKHRPRAPVNGILVAVSFPELAQFRSEQFALYARQVRERINEIDDAFGIKVPVYLLFTKIDLLGGFAQFFEDLDETARNRVWGATLSHDQGPDFNATAVVGQQFDLLYQGLVQMGMEKLSASRGNVTRPALFAFPIEFHGLREAVCRFVEILFEDDPYHGKPLLRGFYFTSALQEGQPRIAAGVRVSSQFGLVRPGFDTAQPVASNSFFLRDLFREVIFPDQYLVTRQTRPAGARLRLAAVAAGLVLTMLATGALTWSFIGNQKLIAAAREEMHAARTLAEAGRLADQLKALQVLQVRLEQLYQARREGHAWQLGWGLYHGDSVERVLRAEYFAGVRAIMLEPVRARLEDTLAGLSQSTGAPATPAARVGERWRVLGGVQLADLRLRPAAYALRTSASPVPAAQVEPAAPSDRLEDAYNALKTYLMLAHRERLEAAHLADQLPRFWRPWLEAQRGTASLGEVLPLAERVVGFYVSQVGEPDLPLIENQQALVASSRELLRGRLHRLSATERVYNELKARANTQFAPMTVGRILNNRDADLVAGSHIIPGAFTREAWERYFRKAIEEASRGQVKGDDWVLAVSHQEDLGADGDVARNRAALLALYKADYAREWEKFLQGVAVRDFASLEQAAQGLARLADAQNSPLRLILARAASETAWDNPSELSRSLASARNSVVERTEKLLLGQTASAPEKVSGKPDLGEVGGRFTAVAALVAGSENGRSPLHAYLEQLARLRTRLLQTAAAPDSGGAARQLMVATLNGSGSEFADALNLADGSLLAGQSDESRATVRPLLVRPLIQAYATLIPAVEREINRAWQAEVMPQWRNLAAKYPFAESGNEAAVADIARFLKPGEGTLARFLDRHLAGLVVRRGEQWVPRTWAGLGVRFHPAFLAGVERLTAVANGVLVEGEGARFELQPVPTPGLSEILIEIDGQVLRYRNGPQAWMAFRWPAGEGAAQGARIQVVSFSGASSSVAHHSGRLGLMRLLTEARVTPLAGATQQLEWRLPAPPGGGEGAQVVRFNFRMVSGADPLALAGLRRLGLPETVAHWEGNR